MITHLIPVFNTESHHLIECVKSIRLQDESPILIIDDGSTNPETIAGLSLIEVMIKDVTVQRLAENMGTPYALNIGHALIDTEYVALMGSSDIALHGKYAAQIEALKKFPKIDVLGTGLQAFYNSNPLRTPIFTFTHKEQPKPGDRKEHKHFLTNHGTVIYRNSAVKAVGGYNEKFRRGQDVELWERMYKNGACFRNLQQIYYLWRR